MKKILYFLISFLMVAPLKAQQNSDMLEKAISSVVTVAVFNMEGAKTMLGYRGVADKAYERILDMTGVQSSGSGFVIEKNGKKYVITNAHVIEAASAAKGSLYVFSIDQTKYEVRVVGGDSFYDIAVLEFVTEPGKEISIVKFANREARLGEQVFAIGNPLGEYPYTVSEGIISAKNRVRNGVTGKFGFVQTTATVIWGNSGGPLVDSKGDVLGINSQIAFATRGTEMIWQPQINFALEAQLSKRLVDDIIDNQGLVKRAWIGLEIVQRYDYNSWGEASGMPWELRDTLPVINKVVPNSPAAAVFGNKLGSVITSVNGFKTRNLQEVLGEFEKVKPGSSVKIAIVNTDGTKEELVVNAGTVEPKNLEALARFVIERDGNMKIFPSEGTLMVKTADMSVRRPEKEERREGQRREDRRPEREKSRGGAAASELKSNFGYRLLAAGLENENWNSIWWTNKMNHLGATLRLCGIAGYVNLYVNDPENPNDVEMKTISFSNDPYVYQLCLWY